MCARFRKFISCTEDEYECFSSPDIDECQSSQSRCQHNTDCINREGSYECRCKIGFSSNGSSCIGKPALVCTYFKKVVIAIGHRSYQDCNALWASKCIQILVCLLSQISKKYESLISKIHFFTSVRIKLDLNVLVIQYILVLGWPMSSAWHATFVEIGVTYVAY
jgi:hypothetical protein